MFENGTIPFKRYSNPNVTEGLVRGVVAEDVDLVSKISDSTIRLCIGLIGRLIDFPLTRRYPTRKVVNGTAGTTRERDLAGACSSGSSYGKSNIVPQTLYSMYNVPSTPSSNASSFGAIQAVYESTQVAVSQTDLTCFTDGFSLPTSTIEDASSFETTSCSSECDEPNLDTQYMAAMNQDLGISYLAYASISDMIVDLTNAPDSSLPFVVSISWGQAESKQETSSLIQQCQEIGVLSSRGVTFFASSGDQGATNSQSPCGTNYNVNFPASCSFVTAVGATTGYTPGSEVVATSPAATITSGGGFSQIFTTGNGFNLDFQSGAVASYLSSSAAANSVSGYPTGGARGLPDISAPGTNYVVMIDSSAAGLDGTS